MVSVTGAGVVVQIRRVWNCPHTEQIRELVRQAAVAAGVVVDLEEVVGDYPSPTVVVHGRDVTGEPLGEGAWCRLDLPTGDQIRAALESPGPGC